MYIQIRTCMHTYIRTHVHTHIHAHIHIHMFRSLHTYITLHYIHAYIHNTHAYIHLYTRASRANSSQHHINEDAQAKLSDLVRFTDGKQYDIIVVDISDSWLSRLDTKHMAALLNIHLSAVTVEQQGEYEGAHEDESKFFGIFLKFLNQHNSLTCLLRLEISSIHKLNPPLEFLCSAESAMTG